MNLTGGIAKNGTTLTLTGGGTININTNGITGSSANSDLVVDGTTVVLNTANSYNGPTTIQNSGTIQLGASNVLPTSPFDDDLRVRIAQAVYGDPALQKYALSPQKPIRIVVDNGRVTLAGVVDSQMDKTIAETRAKSVPNVFSVQDNLVVANQQAR